MLGCGGEVQRKQSREETVEGKQAPTWILPGRPDWPGVVTVQSSAAKDSAYSVTGHRKMNSKCCRKHVHLD